MNPVTRDENGKKVRTKPHRELRRVVKYLTKRQMRMGLEDGTFPPYLDAKFQILFELGT
jgi:hypothetical protein